MKLSFFSALIILFGFISACGDSLTETSKTRQVVLRLAHHEGSGRNLKNNPNLTLGIGTELIKLVPATVIFQSDPKDINEVLDTTLTDLISNKVSLSIPLDTSVKLFAYRYSEQDPANQIEEDGYKPLSFGESNNFVVEEDTESLTVTLKITANGTPGLTMVSDNETTSDEGGISTLTIVLKTQPKQEVTVPFTTDFSGVNLSASSLMFTPLNWSNTQTLTITGKNTDSVLTSQKYQLILGKLLSEDDDYFGLDPDDVTIEHQILVKPVLLEISAAPSLSNDNTPDYTFSSSESGSIQYGGSCSSGNTSAQSDNNTVTFNALSDGEYSNCSITVTDPAGNTSDNLSVRAFTIDTMTPQLVSVTVDNGTSISSDNLSVLAGGFKVTFNEAMKASSMQVNDGSTGDIKINCNSANTLRLGADNTTTPGQNQCRELAQMSSSDNLSWTTLIRAFGNSHCPVTDNLTGTPSGTCAATLNPGTNYKLKLATGMTDLAGNALASENTTLFRTRKTPSIISTFPDNASDNTSVYLAPVFHFDSPMHPASFIDNLSLTVGCSPNPSSGSNCGFSSSYDSTADNLTVNPTGSWPDNTTITVTIKGRNGNFPYSGIYEATDGIFMPSDYVMNFKTSVTYGSDSIVNLSADGVSFKATQFNSIQLSDNESNLGNSLTFREPTFVWGRSNANSNSREWISKALKGKEFISYIYRDNNQKITIYSLDNTSINIYKGENLLVTDNLSENIRKVYNLSNVENQVVRILSTGNILLTIQGETGNDFRPLVPLNQEIYSAGNSQYGYVVINS
ncbi:MAG: Ig-like domain-containing protein, partial [SAR324 cluster bacterium]|nr:Ig-like domain-containing protein [SAR324 cluster bacterium]